MPDGNIPKVHLYGELAIGKWVRGPPHLRFKDYCKKKHGGDGHDYREEGRHHHYRTHWGHDLHLGLERGGGKLAACLRRKAKETITTTSGMLMSKVFGMNDYVSTC